MTIVRELCQLKIIGVLGGTSRSTDILGLWAWACIVQPGGAVDSEVNSGSRELVALVYFDGPVDFVLAE